MTSNTPSPRSRPRSVTPIVASAAGRTVPSRTASSSGAMAPLLPMASGGHGLDALGRQRQPRERAAARRRLQRARPAGRLGDLAHDRQAQAAPRPAAGVGAPVEAVEDVREVVGVD